MTRFLPRIPFLGSLLSDPAERGESTASSSASSSSLGGGKDEASAAASSTTAAAAAYHKLRDAADGSPTRPLLPPGEKEADGEDGLFYEDAYEEEESEIEDLEVFRVGRFAFSLTLLLFATLSVSLLTAGALLFSSFLGKVLMGAGAGLVGILILMLMCGGEREREEEEDEEEGGGAAAMAAEAAAEAEAERRALLLDRKRYYSPRSGGGGMGGVRGSPLLGQQGGRAGGHGGGSGSSSRRESPAAPSRLV
jgi:hypothetical protein